VLTFALTVCRDCASGYISLSVLCQGDDLQLGSRKEDYDITIGDSVCVTVSLTDNQVECRPPAYKPNKHINDTFCDDDAFYLQVC